MFDHVLVPLDGSEYSERALGFAQNLARIAGGKMSLLTVLLRPAGPHVPHVPELDERSKNQGEAYLSSKAEVLRKEGVSEVIENVAFGEPAHSITEYASAGGVDLIVMSTHGIGASGRYALGSVAMKVLMTAPCPVFMVRIEQATESSG